ncbi:MAG: inositol monophosphatase [Bdellovibrionales bacterium]|nr:inositol monophosphatase [Bdellovibrionales bacterium]
MALENPELFQLLKVAKAAAGEANKILLKEIGQLSAIEEKERAGLVTNVDRSAEAKIIEIFKAETPDFAILGEETTHLEGTAIKPSQDVPQWVIDPLDGTTNYVHQLPVFCVSIGLEVSGRTELAVVTVPMLDRVYTAVRGHGAFCNDASISVSDCAKIRESLVATGFITAKPEQLTSQIECFQRVISQCRGVRRVGTAAFDLAMVAHGVFDAYWESNLQPWDTSAGYLLVQEAGGKVTRYDGDDYDSFQPNLLASNGKIHDQLQKLVNPLSCQN